MKKYMKKFLSVFLVFVFFISITPSSAFALSKSQMEEEAEIFLESKGLLNGNIVNIDTVENSVLFTIEFLPNDEPTYIKYEKKVGDIIVVISENGYVDTFLFKSDGTVYLDDVETDYFDFLYLPSMVNTYASAFYNTMPAEASGTYTYFDAISGTMAFDKFIKDLTTYVLARKIEAVMGIPSAVTTALVSQIKTTAQQYDDTGTAISYVRNVYKNNKNYPLKVYFRHDTNYTLACGKKTYATFYEIETLVG